MRQLHNYTNQEAREISTFEFEIGLENIFNQTFGRWSTDVGGATVIDSPTYSHHLHQRSSRGTQFTFPISRHVDAVSTFGAQSWGGAQESTHCPHWRCLQRGLP